MLNFVIIVIIILFFWGGGHVDWHTCWASLRHAMSLSSYAQGEAQPRYFLLE